MPPVCQVFAQMPQAGILCQSVNRSLYFAENSIRGFGAIATNVLPNFVEILFRKWRKDKSLHLLGRSLSNATFPNPRKCFRAVHELPLVRLLYTGGNILAQCTQAYLLYFFPFLQQAQALAQDLTLRLVLATLKKVGDEFIENGTQVDIHGKRLAYMSIVVNC